MNCPACLKMSTIALPTRTSLGYRKFRCLACGRGFNERTGTPFNFLEFPTDIVLLVVRWRLRYKLSLRDLAEMMLERGVVLTHEAIRNWQERLAPLVADALGRHRRGRVGPSWYVDETYLRVGGRWVYLYRAMDRDGTLVDCRLSEQRDFEAARAFFRQALATTGIVPERVTIDGHDAYPRVIREEVGPTTLHRTNRYLNNRIEQDHRGIKQRYTPMRGFKTVTAASLFCRAFDELRNLYRPNSPSGTAPSLHQRRRFHLERTALVASLVRAR